MTLFGGAGGDSSCAVNIQSLTGNITNNGSGYTAGKYTNVQFDFVSGTEEPSNKATADFTVPGWELTINNAGSGYEDSEYTGVTAYNLSLIHI